MMIAKAKGRFIPVTPRKIRLVARMLKGRPALEAQAMLRNMNKGTCRPVAKILDSAIANATRQGAWKADQLVISKISADEGPMIERYRAAAMGRAMVIRKRMCHLTVELEAKNEAVKNGS